MTIFVKFGHKSVEEKTSLMKWMLESLTEPSSKQDLCKDISPLEYLVYSLKIRKNIYKI